MRLLQDFFDDGDRLVIGAAVDVGAVGHEVIGQEIIVGVVPFAVPEKEPMAWLPAAGEGGGEARVHHLVAALLPSEHGEVRRDLGC
jgi:hypothetical protein